MLEFHGDAICLSGVAGTKLKSDIVGAYYPFWWSITSGGHNADYGYETAIIELHAGTGEIYIKDLDEIILGSAGHALELKSSRLPDTRRLKIVLVEENRECCDHLKNVIGRRWPNIPVDRIEGPWASDISQYVYLLHRSLDDVLPIVKNMRGNAIYFFDPLRSIDWEMVEKVAANRISTFYHTGTEFMIFLFTSDWFLGRDEFVPLPKTPGEADWSPEEYASVQQADSLMGDRTWRQEVLPLASLDEREYALVSSYKYRLRDWFRYVLPLPFNPKGRQLYHLIVCSNYDAGVRMTRQFYSMLTENPAYAPDSSAAYKEFKLLHKELLSGLKGSQRPSAWKTLWQTIRQHEDGVCDVNCSDLIEKAGSAENLRNCMDWLEDRGYITATGGTNLWNEPVKQYVLNWPVLTKKLKVEPPAPFQPISSEQLYQKMTTLRSYGQRGS